MNGGAFLILSFDYVCILVANGCTLVMNGGAFLILSFDYVCALVVNVRTLIMNGGACLKLSFEYGCSLKRGKTDGVHEKDKEGKGH